MRLKPWGIPAVREQTASQGPPNFLAFVTVARVLRDCPVSVELVRVSMNLVREGAGFDARRR
jgi:hypothetical protein